MATIDQGAGVVVQPDGTIGRRVASSAAWMILGRATIRLIGFAGTLVLVRLLSPADFGIVAMAGIAGGMLENLSGFSFDLALVQAQGVDRARSDTVWTLNVLRGLALSLLTAAIAPGMAAVMEEPRIEPVMYVLALAPLVQGFENIALVNWQRDLHFNRIFRLNTCGKIIALSLVIPCALIFNNYWALVIAQVGKTAVVVPLGYYLYPYRPRFTIAAWRSLFHFSKWLLASNLLSMAENYSAGLLISRLFGPATLGLCQIAYEIGHLPAMEIAAPIRQPMYAGYARVAHNRDALRDQVVGGFGIVLMLMLPVSVGMAVTAAPISALFLGSKWAGSAPLIAIFVMIALFENLRYSMNHIYIIRQAQARYACMLAVTQIVRVVCIVALGLTYGVIAVLLGILVIGILNFIVLWVGLLDLIEMHWSDFVRVSWRTVVAAVAMGAGVRGIAAMWPGGQELTSLVLQIGTLCLSGIVIQVGVQLWLWNACGRVAGPERNAFEWSQAALRNLWRRARAFASGGEAKTNAVEL